MLGFFSHYKINENKMYKGKLKTLNYLLSNFVSYSQDFEDFILFYLFYDIEKGFYIDVGANDPNIFSVTKAFYERGWHGINIEPLPFKYKLLKQYRPRDINLQYGIGINEGNATIRVLGLCSSLIYNKKKNNSKFLNINIKNMSNICNTYVPNRQQIQFCKIDVEGSEKNVLLGFNFLKYRPKIFCIESLINPKTNTPEYKEWEFILIKNDYEFAYNFKRNRFYYDKRIKGMKEKFNRIEFFVNKFKKNL